MSQVPLPYEYLKDHYHMRVRIRNLLLGVTPMLFYPGSSGLNTPWQTLTPGSGWQYSDPDSYVQWRVRSDVNYMRTVGTGGLQPVGTWPPSPTNILAPSATITGWSVTNGHNAPRYPGVGEALRIPANNFTAWPTKSHTMYVITDTGGWSKMTVRPDGRIYIEPPSSGTLVRPGSCSWPRG